MTISCRDFIAHLGGYLDDDVAEELRRALDQHLAACSTCRIIVDSSNKTVTIVTDAGKFDLERPLPDPVIERIMDRVRAGRKPSS